MKRETIEKKAAEQGLYLRRYCATDTRRISPDGSVARWYLACAGLILASFETLADVDDWLSEREDTAIFMECLPD